MRGFRCLGMVIGLLAVVAVVAAVFFIFVLKNNHTLDIEAVDRTADQRILFIGNSFTHGHDLFEMVDVMLEESNPAWNDVVTGQHAPGGTFWADHVGWIENAEENHPLRQVLVTGSDTLRDWNAVVLQEQSQMLGYGQNTNFDVDSFGSGQSLHRYIMNTGAMTFLFMTWGYRDGDDTNYDYYPNYLTMQRHLMNGYDQLGAVLQAQGGRVYVIPIGLAFQTVFYDEQAAGHDPTSDGTRFFRLYENDGRHPSLEGSYLAACVLTVAYSGQPASNLSYRPDGMDEETARYLRGVADRVVLQNVAGDRVYPFEE